VSWSEALHLASAAVHKHVGVGGGPEPTADAAAPMGAHIGSLLTLKVNTFLRAQGSLVGIPPSTSRTVAISRLRTPVDGQVHRLYSACGDDGETGPAARAFLQIYSVGSDIREIGYFRRLLRIIPTSEEDQTAFLGEDGAGLGNATFSVYREQLAGLGLDESVVAQAFGDNDAIEYTRAAGTADQEWIEPYHGTENRINDAQGITGLHQDVVFMLYARTLAGGAQEQLLICTEIVSDRDGDTSAREIHVDFMIGLVLTQDGVLVQ
jgi:hypothetical protein